MIHAKKGMFGLLYAAAQLLPNDGNGKGREFQSLDGTWRIVFDANNEGREKQWGRDKQFPKDQQREIIVSSCGELTEKDYEDVAFSRRTFKVPETWKKKVVHLRFEAVNFRAEVWLNNAAVGAHEGGFTRFEFRVDDLLKFDDDNTLGLRVVGPILMQDKRVDSHSLRPFLKNPQSRDWGGPDFALSMICGGEGFKARLNKEELQKPSNQQRSVRTGRWRYTRRRNGAEEPTTTKTNRMNGITWRAFANKLKRSMTCARGWTEPSIATRCAENPCRKRKLMKQRPPNQHAPMAAPDDVKTRKP